MSSLTQCNFCSLRAIRAEAKRKKEVVHIVTAYGGGLDVFVVPKTVKRSDIMSWQRPNNELPNGDANYEKYFKAWLMNLTGNCVC